MPKKAEGFMNKTKKTNEIKNTIRINKNFRKREKFQDLCNIRNSTNLSSRGNQLFSGKSENVSFRLLCFKF